MPWPSSGSSAGPALSHPCLWNRNKCDAASKFRHNRAREGVSAWGRARHPSMSQREGPLFRAGMATAPPPQGPLWTRMHWCSVPWSWCDRTPREGQHVSGRQHHFLKLEFIEQTLRHRGFTAKLQSRWATNPLRPQSGSTWRWSFKCFASYARTPKRW